MGRKWLIVSCRFQFLGSYRKIFWSLSRRTLGKPLRLELLKPSRARNAKVHGQTHGTPVTIAVSILEALTDMHLFPFREQWNASQPKRLLSPSFWHPPPPGWIKININVDGALSSSGVAGTGAILRDEQGNSIVAMGHNFEHWDIARVELQALIAIQQIIEPWMYECKGVLLEGENLNIIRLMCDSVTRNFWEGHPSLSQDLAFLASFKQVVFLHTKRDCNRAAHFCATLA